ncbi:MAG: GNAT family N-acetyltransferase [Clostridiales bacterium]|nr:GNAT family N-acetyltransferase [Clostridiales bacterium]
MQEYRNKGNGTALLSYIKNYLRDKGCELIIVWPSDNSINWYLRNGFNSENDVLECEL